ncbi:hypothetical protein CCAX7_54050 [Capsulimonas corticalis]|uniref:Uncharacterized protein n=1 Tax=Capsulimonas corticalis TaxID=2219043 RepID=A0A402CNQ7_9BACT|nr:hypothetical protein [Capsulimonas corticalis]BDI33354.1 hypothetical protein CCAX7_54050 [Capsulimonas corticalis]
MVQIGKRYRIEHPRQRAFEGLVTAIDGEYAVVNIEGVKNHLVVGDRYVKDQTIEVLIAKSKFTEVVTLRAESALPPESVNPLERPHSANPLGQTDPVNPLGRFDGMSVKDAVRELRNMSGLMEEDIRSVATSLRKELESGSYDVSTGLSAFPVGACGAAAEILQRRLKAAGMGEFKYICRYRYPPDGRTVTHAWLEKDDLIVDITADQFEGEGQDPVIVTRFSPWHAAWQTPEQQGESK